jgi:hypothetical protein
MVPVIRLPNRLPRESKFSVAKIFPTSAPREIAHF